MQQGAGLRRPPMGAPQAMDQQLLLSNGQRLNQSSGGPRIAPRKDLLEDLCSRFVLNVPPEELESFDRMLFQLEQAHWFYEDVAREDDPSLKSYSLKDFTSLMFQRCTALKAYEGQVDEIYENFTSYKVKVPVTGAIILDKSLEKCLLVKGYKAGASWGFPKGKKNHQEPDVKCAVREVEEETGFSIKDMVDENEYLECEVNQQRCRLYVVPGVDDNTLFATKTIKEISEIGWHYISELPERSSPTAGHKRAPNGCKYFMVWPLTRDLKAWIARYKAKLALGFNNSPTAGANGQSSGLPGAGVPFPVLGQLGVPSLGPPLDQGVTFAPPEVPPGQTFREFRFDQGAVLRALEAALAERQRRPSNVACT